MTELWLSLECLPARGRLAFSGQTERHHGALVPLCDAEPRPQARGP